MDPDIDNDLIIIGGGAAGLMAGVCAGETSLRCALLERKHRPGLKLLMCGNNRCNVTHAADIPEMARAYGEDVGRFLGPALAGLSPSGLRSWFETRGLRTTVHADDRVFPASEKADDVLHCFTDCLRDLEVPLVLNCPVSSIGKVPGGFEIRSERMALRTRFLLLVTGGVSYPKTGSVGDGQRFAKALGHRIEPYRAGLAGIEFAEDWLRPRNDISLPDTVVTVLSGGESVCRTEGEILLTSSCARGPAMVNASRLMARQNLADVSFCIDLVPSRTEAELIESLGCEDRPGSGRFIQRLRKATALPSEFIGPFAGNTAGRRGHPDAESVARSLKRWILVPRRVRPLKEAMVTVGGVALDEVDPERMESRLCPGLFLAGEILDIDGPTGGYNLHAAFATAQLAVRTIASEAGALPRPSSRRRSRQRTGRHAGQSGPQRRQRRSPTRRRPQ